MKEKINAAIEVFLSDLEEQTRNINETKKMINALRSKIGEEPLFTDIDLPQNQNISRPDIFYGKPLSTAAREFLEWKKRACMVEEILQGLTQGGFDFKALGWKENDRLRSLAVSLAKNSAIFHRLPTNNAFGLLAWYPEVQKAKTEKEKDQAENTEGKNESTKENGNVNVDEVAKK